MDQMISWEQRFRDVEAAYHLLNEEMQKLLSALRITEMNRSAPRRAHRKGEKSTLAVDYNGRHFSGPCAADVMADCVAAMGLERVSALNLRRGPLPLVGRKQPPPDRGSRQRNGYYVVTHASNLEKKGILEAIANRLGEKISVEVR
jgi:hypothetical protein